MLVRTEKSKPFPADLGQMIKINFGASTDRAGPKPKKETDNRRNAFHHEQRQMARRPKHKTEMPKSTAHFLNFGPVFATTR